MPEVAARACFCFAIACFGGAVRPAGPADVYTYSHSGDPKLPSPKFPDNVLSRRDAAGKADRWYGTVVLLGPGETGKAGRWEVRNSLTDRLLYEAEGWDGTGAREFTRVYGAALPKCSVAAYP